MKRIVAIACVCVASAQLFGQGYEAGPPTNGVTPYLDAAGELKLLELQDGYYLEPVLTDPVISDPVDITFDGNGRLYVLEMRTYMTDADATGERDAISVVSRHEDTNGDGTFDKHTEFASGLLLPRKIMPLDNGVVIGETHTHDLKYYEDTDGDGVADKIELFHEGGKRGGNMEHQPSGFVWGMDNWWYSTYNNFRYRYTGGTFEKGGMHGNAGQWGIAVGIYGKPWLINAGRENGPECFQHHILYGRSGVGKSDWKEFSRVWPIDNYPDTQGGHRRLRPDNTLNHFTATCGPEIFKGDRLPADLIGNLFFGEPVGRLVRRAVVTYEDDGSVSMKNAYEQDEFIRTRDPNFRPISMTTAPDGTLYIVDMYRGIIQQGNWTRKGSYLRKVIDAYGLDKNIDKGRIWRLRHKEFDLDLTKPRMLSEKPSELLRHLSHPNGWWRLEAQKLIVLSGDKSVLPALKKIAASHSNPLSRLHAYWTIEGLEAMSPDLVQAAAADGHERVREAACRLAEPFVDDNEEIAGLLKRLSEDQSGIVRVQAALSMRYKGKAERPLTAGNTKPAASTMQFASADMQRIKKGETIYKELCSTCHGADGKGVVTSDKQKLAPQLMSHRVTGDPGFSISTVLYGLQGKLDNHEYVGQLMAPMGANDDNWVASVLSYVRTSFGNEAMPISPAMVADVRKRDKRDAPWTQSELETHYNMAMKDRKSWKLTASHNAGKVAAAIDGNPASRFDTATPQKKGMWVNIEFPDERLVSGLRLDNQGSPKDGHKGELMIEVSSDGKSWKPVDHKSCDGQQRHEFVFDQPVKVKHVRMTLTEGVNRWYWSIHDLQVYGRKA